MRARPKPFIGKRLTALGSMLGVKRRFYEVWPLIGDRLFRRRALAAWLQMKKSREIP